MSFAYNLGRFVGRHPALVTSLILALALSAWRPWAQQGPQEAKEGPKQAQGTPQQALDPYRACEERGKAYFASLQPQDKIWDGRLSDGRLASEVARDRCSRTVGAF